jgi:Kdo2-lipid IVA lauroyltransferase/acyltransferase
MVWPRKLYLALCYVFARITPRAYQLWHVRVVGRIFYFFMRKTQRIVQKNLSVVLNRRPDDPAVRRTALQVFQNYGLYLLDYVRLNHLNKYLLPEGHGETYIKKALADGNGAILVTPHLGHWELGGVLFAMRQCPIHALSLKDPEAEVQDFRDRIRATLGIHTVHIDPANFGNVLNLVKLLKENQVIALLGDRFEGGKSVEVRFFGKQVLFPAGAMALALNSGAPVIPVFTVVKPDGYYLAWMDRPIRVHRTPGVSTAQLLAEKTQELANIFESVVSRYPDQWYHFFDYWKRYACKNPPAGSPA